MLAATLDPYTMGGLKSPRKIVRGLSGHYPHCSVRPMESRLRLMEATWMHRSSCVLSKQDYTD